MKIPELKLAIANHSKEDLAYLVAELYKLVPKAKKEDSGIDEIIVQGKPAADAPKPKKVAQFKSFEDLKVEIDTFIHHAVSEHYLGKERVIAKKDRPKWRFTCKALIKDLFELQQRDKVYKLACVEYLEKIYHLLSIGGNYQYFSAEDTFASVGMEHEGFCLDIIKLYYQVYNLQMASDKAVDLLLLECDRPNSYFPSRRAVFLPFLDTDEKLEAIIKAGEKHLIDLNIEIKEHLEAEKKKRYPDSSIPYRMKENIGNITGLVFHAMFLLELEEEAIDFYYKNDTRYDDRDLEIKLYILVRELMSIQQRKHVVKEIEKAVEKGISPRKNLVELHKGILEGKENIYF